MIKSLLIIGMGGFIGTIFRSLITRYAHISWVSSFPWGTFAVNILGSFLFGVFFGLSEKGQFMSAEWRLFLTVGLCGGFTTFSTFSNDALFLLENKELFRFAIYGGVSFFLGIVAVLIGRTLVKIM